MSKLADYMLPPGETIDITLLLIAESGHYCVSVMRELDQLPPIQKVAMTSALLRGLPPEKQCAIFDRFNRIEAAYARLAETAT